MNDLAIRDKFDIVEADDWKERSDQLFTQVISYNLPEELQEESDKKILDFYMENFKFLGGKVSINDVFSDVIDYNQDLMAQIAFIYYEAGNYHKEAYIGMERDDIIDEIAMSEYEVLQYDYFNELDTYIEEILLLANVGFEYPKYHDIYSSFGRGENVKVVYDSQNFLLPELYRVGFASAERYCWDYMRTRVIAGSFKEGD